MKVSTGPESPYALWAPRIILGVCIVLLVYFTQRTYRFRGNYDETFLAPSNLNLVRGPLAKEEYYKRGELGYVGAPLFEEASGEISEPTEELDLSQGVSAPIEGATATSQE
jgi:hypothetical protein